VAGTGGSAARVLMAVKTRRRRLLLIKMSWIERCEEM
jgi:hypothetical protein